MGTNEHTFQSVANICVTHDNILLDNSMAEMADSADDDIAARSSTFAFVRH